MVIPKQNINNRLGRGRMGSEDGEGGGENWMGKSVYFDDKHVCIPDECFLINFWNSVLSFCPLGLAGRWLTLSHMPSTHPITSDLVHLDFNCDWTEGGSEQISTKRRLSTMTGRVPVSDDKATPIGYILHGLICQKLWPTDNRISNYLTKWM